MRLLFGFALLACPNLAVCRASELLARGVDDMRAVQHCVRIDATQHRALVALAERYGLSRYKMLVRIIGIGLTTLSDRTPVAESIGELTSETATLGARVTELQRLCERTLFVSVSAYCFAKAAASGQRPTTENITDEINAAFKRQMNLIQEHSNDQK